jgi:hypothetical protein
MTCFSTVKTATVAEPDPAKHVNYNLGMVLGVDDFTQEFAYLSERDQWMARDLIGYGTARGLKIGIEDSDKGPRVVVEAGVAVSPRGQMICVPSAQCAYLKDSLASRSGEIQERFGSPLSGTVDMYVVLCYRDCPTDDVPIAGEPCRSEDELTAPSRLTDDFCLELRFNQPNQREEKAVRKYVEWLRRIEISDAVPVSTPLEQFLDAIRAEAWEWLSPSSPPASPPYAIMPGSPPAFLHIRLADACKYLHAALLLWVTELRPKWIARWHGCAPTHFAVDDKTEEDCVMLAKLTVPIALVSPGVWTVADRPAVVEKDESERPYLIHLRMLQEWILCGTNRPITLSGDAVGPVAATTVQGLQTVPIALTRPTNGQVLTFDAVAQRWQPATLPPPPNLAGDVINAPTSNRVQQLQGRNLVLPGSGNLTDGQVLTARSNQLQLEALPVANLAGDVVNPLTSNRVQGLQGTILTLPAPGTLIDGQVLTARTNTLGLEALPAPTLGGDVGNASTNNRVNRLQGRILALPAPDGGALPDGQVLTARGNELHLEPLPAAAAGNFVEHPAALPRYSIVAAGIIRVDGARPRSRQPIYNTLRVVTPLQPNGDISFTFGTPGGPTDADYRLPSTAFMYIVKALAVRIDGEVQPTVTFVRFDDTSFVLNVGSRIGQAQGQRLELMIEVSRYEAPRLG